MNTYYIAGYPVTDELYHHGIKGQRWGIRRYQNEDGSLTPAGRERYQKAFEEAVNAYHDKWESGELKNNPGNPSQKISNKIDKIKNRNIRESNYEQLQKERTDALQKRNKQSVLKELFMPNNKLQKQFEVADKKAREATQKVIERSLLESYDVASKLPKKQRAAAMAYVYETLGLDW